MFKLKVLGKVHSLGKQLVKASSSLLSTLTQVNVFSDTDSKVVVLSGVSDKSLQSSTTYIKYPAIWLRDNCQCDHCYHKGSNSRMVDWCNFDVNVKPDRVWYDNQSSELKITWSDLHESTHALGWLLERQFDASNRIEYLQQSYRPIKRPWRKDQFDATLKTFHFSDLINTNEGLYSWLHALAVDGVATISGAPQTEFECRRLADRVGFIRRTHYGEEFIVRAKEETSNVAYLTTPLQMHTDLPYYEYKPGVNLLHCLVQTQSSGAFNLLTDGFWVANEIRQQHPEMFETLTRTLVNWWDLGKEDGNRFHSIYRSTVICLDIEGQFQRINHSVPQRDSHFSIPVEKVYPWYRALHKFVELLHQEAVSFKTKPGEILTFDNTRMVHGRTGFTDEKGNTRHLVGAYLDWDEIYSRIRVLDSEVRTNVKY